jgi:RHS repeat-associated protein
VLEANFGNDIEMKKNGYLYVFVSNESKMNVYFDDIHVEHERGALLEETHYYPWGLTMASISSSANGPLFNKIKYNSLELQADLDLDSYSAFYRDLNPQIGRWQQIDPKIENMENWSPYASNYNNPITYNDPLGDEPNDPGPWARLWQATKKAASDALDYAGGFVTAVADNQSSGLYNARESHGSRANNRNAFDAGQDGGDIFSMFVGAVETGLGLGATGAGIIAAPATGGTSLTVSAGGIVVAGIGISTTINATTNLINQKGRDEIIHVDPKDKIPRDQLDPPNKPGNAPTFKKDKKPVEIHHEGQNPSGPFKEMHPQDHRGKGNDKQNHPNKGMPSKIDRKAFRKDVMEYWKQEFPK